ncbi:hypothetical protein U9M48_002031 [Paspalum notatum var. saurae]|uniref:DUF295 domain-containing protein n=1 Tax=Paspalum notatum var. saurae TaxID=547442 RepID=A0AAQ3PQK1_PASNO
MESAGAAAAGAVVLPDWTNLPQEILVSLLGLLEVADLIRSGAVCASWHDAYEAFRRLRLPSPRQPPCLLYSSDAFSPDAAALYCPSTGATFRVPMPPLRSLSPIGAAHGWLVVADEVSNLHLLNPLTGARAALPPITGLYNVEPGTSLDEDGNLVYSVHEDAGDATRLAPIPVAEARACMYDQAALSCGPASGGGRACVVLLLHTPLGSLSFARPGDERWTWIPPGERTGLRWSNSYRAAAYNDKDGLFYVVDSNDAIYALDLHGPSPVARRVLSELRHGDQPYRYLIHAPWGELLQAWRFREYHDPSMPPVEMAAEDDDDYRDPLVELRTDELQLYSVDGHGQRLLKLDGLENHALFLGYNGSLCLSVKEFPGLKSNCAYIMDDSTEFINYYKDNKREIGVWNMESQILQTIRDTSPPKVPWLNWPTPIWITPSLL